MCITFTDSYLPDNIEWSQFPQKTNNNVKRQLHAPLQVSHYIITCYLPSGMFVMVSWISFLIPPDVVPGRMTLLITIFLVLVNIFNTITTNIPKAEGLVEPLNIDSLLLYLYQV